MARRKPSNSQRKRANLLTAQCQRCCYCGTAFDSEREANGSATFEHIVGFARGGGNSLNNLVLAHRRCNAMAAAWTLAEKIFWMRRAGVVVLGRHRVGWLKSRDRSSRAMVDTAVKIVYEGRS